jgi:hypothetical protein
MKSMFLVYCISRGWCCKICMLLGNSASVPVVEMLGRAIVETGEVTFREKFNLVPIGIINYGLMIIQ